MTHVGAAGVIGWPVAHSRSPIIHRFWLDALGLDGDYGRFAVPPEQLGDAIRALPALGLRGVNVTVPHKVAAMRWLDAIDPAAAAVGAVNSLRVLDDGRIEGFNTDIAGVLEPLAGFARREWREEDALVIGAGGAARAAVAALKALGCSSVTVLNRTPAHAAAMLEAVGMAGVALPLDVWLVTPRKLLINASALGMAGMAALPFEVASLADGATVFDMVYAPLETPLLRDARTRGLTTIDGLAMLVAQAAAAFELFYGVAPPRDRDAELRALLTR